MPIATCPVESYRLETLLEHDAALIAFHYQSAPDADLEWTPRLVLHRDELRRLAGRLLEAAQTLEKIAAQPHTPDRH